MLAVWLAVVLLGGTSFAAPPYAASIRAPQIELDLHLESPHEHDHDSRPGESIALDADGTSPVSPLREKRQSTGTYQFDFKWVVKRWAAIGDSYTAGIGAGSKLGSPLKNTDDYYCSRHTHAWPRIMAKWLGGNIHFQFPACSGAKSTDIYQQVNSLTGLSDLVVMMAGGNDMCLNALVKACVVTAYDGEQACDDAIAKAQTNLRTIVKTNLRYILDALIYKMTDNGMVMILGYAPFDDTNEDCTQQDWAVESYGSVNYQLGTGLRLTTARRARFNKLVHDMNTVLRELVDEYSVDPRAASINLGFVDWSGWPAAVGGEMCNPLGDGSYPEPRQPKLLFFKPRTKPQFHDELRRRNTNQSDNGLDNERLVLDAPAVGPGLNHSGEAFDESHLSQSPNAPEIAVEQLDKRAPTPPICPGNNAPTDAFGKLLPDYIGRWFHPNVRGHGAMASFMLTNIAVQRAQLMGIPGADMCVRVDKDAPQCFGANSNRKDLFVSWRNMDKHVKEFCDDIIEPPSPLHGNWEYSWTFNEGTPDEFDILFKMRNGASFWNGAESCKKNFPRLVHDCDVNRPDNPMNYKWGGRWARYNEIYEIKPKTERKLHTRPDGRCRAKDSGAWHAYKVEGRGWASDDKGSKLWDNIRECAAEACASFRFGYYERDEHEDDWEWWATFTCPKGKVDRCWNNQEIPKATGGYTHKWRQKSANERYEDGGCTRDMSY